MSIEKLFQRRVGRRVSKLFVGGRDLYIHFLRKKSLSSLNQVKLYFYVFVKKSNIWKSRDSQELSISGKFIGRKTRTFSPLYVCQKCFQQFHPKFLLTCTLPGIFHVQSSRMVLHNPRAAGVGKVSRELLLSDHTVDWVADVRPPREKLFLQWLLNADTLLWI